MHILVGDDGASRFDALHHQMCSSRNNEFAIIASTASSILVNTTIITPCICTIVGE